MPDTELYSPNLMQGKKEHGYIYGSNVGLQAVTYTVYNGLAIFEGDIVLGNLDSMAMMNDLAADYFRLNGEHDRQATLEMTIKACAIMNVNMRWPNATIPYKIAKNHKMKSVIEDAIRYVNRYIEIELIPSNLTAHSNYVEFIEDNGSWSYVGMQGLMQKIGISSKAKCGNVVHEVFHAAGMWHEHSRQDRDQFVKIEKNNIKDEAMHNFDMAANKDSDLGYYDYSSIMHYSEKAFSKNGDKTIKTRQPGVKIGQRDEASIRDKLGIQAMYQFSNTAPIIELSVVSGRSIDTPAPSGFVKLHQDVNEGANGEYIYICYKKGSSQQQNEAITDILFHVENQRDDLLHSDVPSGYIKIGVDLNMGAGGKHIYLCYKKGRGTPIRHITVVSLKSSESQFDPGYSLTLIPQDLNEGARGKYIYLCYKKDPIEDICVISGSNDEITPSQGFERINVDLSMGAGGKYIYLCYKRGTPKICDIALVSDDKPDVSPPAGYTKLQQDLNEKSGGKYIYVCYKPGGSDPIYDIRAIYGNSANINPQKGWTKIPQDTNEGAGGKYIYICYRR